MAEESGIGQFGLIAHPGNGSTLVGAVDNGGWTTTANIELVTDFRMTIPGKTRPLQPPADDRCLFQGLANSRLLANAVNNLQELARQFW